MDAFENNANEDHLGENERNINNMTGGSNNNYAVGPAAAALPLAQSAQNALLRRLMMSGAGAAGQPGGVLGGTAAAAAAAGGGSDSSSFWPPSQLSQAGSNQMEQLLGGGHGHGAGIAGMQGYQQTTGGGALSTMRPQHHQNQSQHNSIMSNNQSVSLSSLGYGHPSLDQATGQASLEAAAASSVSDQLKPYAAYNPSSAAAAASMSATEGLYSSIMGNNVSQTPIPAAAAYSNMPFVNTQPTTLPYQGNFAASGQGGASGSAMQGTSSLMAAMMQQQQRSSSSLHAAFGEQQRTVQPSYDGNSGSYPFGGSVAASSFQPYSTSLNALGTSTSYPSYANNNSSSQASASGNAVVAQQRSSLLLSSDTLSSSYPSLDTKSSTTQPSDSNATSAGPPSSQLASSDSSTQDQPPAKQPGNVPNVTSLVVPTDAKFLEPVHIFLRSSCIEVFVSTKEDMMSPGRGARASSVGQVGLRCAFCKDIPREELARQAICYPSKRDTIFESVRNYQRVHMEDCPRIPGEVYAKYKTLIDVDSPKKKPQRLVKAYYAEAASEVGLVDTTKGLIFGAPPNTSGMPSERVMAVFRAAESPANSAAFWEQYSSSRDKSLELRKFEHLASETTRDVIRNARRDASALVYPQDFPTVSDFEFLLWKQVSPCRPSATTLKRRGMDPSGESNALLGLCCKHCARAHKGEMHHKGMWFPMNCQSLTESSFSQSLLNHMLSCENIPEEVRDSFDELRRLASEHNVIAKRGSRKKFLEKIWNRLKNFHE